MLFYGRVLNLIVANLIGVEIPTLILSIDIWIEILITQRAANDTNISWQIAWNKNANQNFLLVKTKLIQNVRVYFLGVFICM
jgi:hypothetical protein